MEDIRNVLIPDGESTWAINVIQCLGELPYSIHVLSRKRKTASRYSKFTATYSYFDEVENDNQWLDIILSKVKEKNIDIIVPIAEREMVFLNRFENDISDHVKMIAIPSVNNIDLGLNKEKLHDFLKVNGFPSPKAIVCESKLLEPNQIDQLSFPVLLKPFNGKGGEGVLRFDQKKDLTDYLEAHQQENFLLQEYIDGYDIDCSVLCKNGSILTYTIQKQYIPNKNPYAPQLGVVFVENEQVMSIMSSLMKKLEWDGIAHVDMRYDSKTNDYKFIEINARFWGSLEASKKVGVNFADLSIKEQLNGHIEHKPYRLEAMVIFKGLLKLIGQKPSTIFKLKFLYQHSNLGLFIKDPLPNVFRFQEWFMRRIRVNK